MKKITTIFIVLLTLIAPASVNAQVWDAPTCADICAIVAQGKTHELDAIMRNKFNFQYNSKVDTYDGVIVLYTKNADVDAQGNLLGLSKHGVSCTIMAHLSQEGIEIGISFFSAANARKFLNQAFELGFSKMRTTRGVSYYNLDYLMIEDHGPEKVGRYTGYSFKVARAY